MMDDQIQKLVISSIFSNARQRMRQFTDDEAKLFVLLDVARELDENKPSRPLNHKEAGEIMKVLGRLIMETSSIESILDVLEIAVHRIHDVSIEQTEIYNIH
jgi:prophage antirepressor-like protein